MAAEVRILVVTSASGSAVADAKKDVQDLGKTAKDAGGGFSALKEIGVGALRELGSMAAGAAVEGLKALGGAIMDGIQDAREAAKINAQTAATIKSMGNVAGVSAEHVQDFAASLSAAAGKSLFGDSQIQESTNLLLTFGNIKGAALDAATAVSVDLAQALGGAPKDQAMMLGKALNDPIKGISALGKAGLTFSEDQKAMIESLVKTGDVAGAQKIILDELNKQVGGSAAAAAAADGGWAQFNDRMGEAKEAIGTAILPLLGQLSGSLNDTIAPAIETAAAAFSTWLNDPATQAGLATITTTIKDGLAVAFAYLTDTAIPALIAGWQAIQPAIQAAIPIITAIIGAFMSAGDGIATFSSGLHDSSAVWTAYKDLVAAELAAIWAIIQAVLAQIMAFWQAHGAEITAFAQATWAQIVEIVHVAIELLQATIIPALQSIAAFISAHGTEIQGVLTVVWGAIKVIVTTALAIIKGIITAALAIVKGDWSGAWNAIKTVAQTIWDAIKALIKLNLDLINVLFRTTWDGIKAYFQGIMASIVGWIVQTFEGIKNAIVSSAGKLRSAAGGVADAIVSGITSGIASGASAIINAAKDAAMDALNAAKAALGIGSPSKVFAMEIGKPMAEGMAMGLAGGAPMVAGAAQYAAGAALTGASSVTNNRSFGYAPTINNYGGGMEHLDYNVANALAGAGG